MAQDHAIPVPRRALAVVRPGTGPGPAAVPPVPDAGPGPGTGGRTDAGTVPVSVLPAAPVPVPVPMTVPERVRRAVRQGVAGARGIWSPFARLFRAAWHGNAKTMAEHRVHIKSRAWVPPEMTGKAEWVIAWAGITYHLVIARPLKAASKTVDAAADYPLCLLLLAVFVAVLFVIVPHI